MADIQETISILGAVGFGSIMTVVIQSWIDSRSEKEKRHFNEKKEAYTGLWAAHLNISNKSEEAALREFVYWHARCDMVAPKSVRDAIQHIIDANQSSKESKQSASTSLRKAIRDDIGVSK